MILQREQFKFLIVINIHMSNANMFDKTLGLVQPTFLCADRAMPPFEQNIEEQAFPPPPANSPESQYFNLNPIDILLNGPLPLSFEKDPLEEN